MRSKSIWLAGVILLGCFLGVVISSAMSGRVEVSGTGTSADPVTITGPSEIVEAISSCKYAQRRFGPGNNGLVVDWGDGSDPFEGLVIGQDCSDRQRTHVYPAPGEYRIEVVKWHPGPTDAQVTDWEGAVTVRVP